MPLIDARCLKCGMVKEVFVHELPAHIECECGGTMRRLYSISHYTRPPKGYNFDFKAGYDWGAGKYFDTKSERDRWEATSGITVKDKGYYGPRSKEEEVRRAGR